MAKKLGNILNFEGFSKEKYRKEPRKNYTQTQNSDDLFDFFELINSWEEVVGKNLSAHTIPLKNTRKELTILTDHPMYSQQISFMSDIIIKKIIEKFPALNKKIKSIKFQTNTAFFKKIINESKLHQKKQKKTIEDQKIHKYSPKYRKLKSNADLMFDTIEDFESRQLLESIYIQAMYDKDTDI